MNLFSQKSKTDDTRILLKCDKNSDALILNISLFLNV